MTERATISPNDLRRLPRCASNQSQPFLGRGVQRRVTDALAGDVHPDMTRAVRSMVTQRMLRLDEVTARLLHHAGINPSIAAAIAMLTSSDIHEIQFERDGAVFARLGLATHVRLGVAGWWDPPRSKLAHLQPVVPETMQPSYLGGPLHDLVSHPAIDDLPLRIEAIETEGRHGHVTVSGLRWLTDDLLDYL